MLGKEERRGQGKLGIRTFVVVVVMGTWHDQEVIGKRKGPGFSRIQLSDVTMGLVCM